MPSGHARLGRVSRAGRPIAPCSRCGSSTSRQPPARHVPHLHAPLDGIPRQSSGGHPRGEDAAGSRQPPGVLCAHRGRSGAPRRCLQRILRCRTRSTWAANAFPSICRNARSRRTPAVALIRGDVARGTVFQDGRLAIFGAEDLFESPETVAKPGQIAPRDVLRRSVRSEARRLRGPCGARRRAVPRHPRNRAGRHQRRLHADRICRRQQALCAAGAHGSGAAIPRRRRSQARSRPHGRRHLDPHQNAHQNEDARHGGRATEALRRSANWPQASRFRPTATGSASSKTPSNSPKRATRRRPLPISNATWKARSRWTVCSAAMSVTARRKS